MLVFIWKSNVILKKIKLYLLDLHMNVLIVKRQTYSISSKTSKATDTSQQLKGPCGLDCVRKWFTLNKYTYTHSRAGWGRNQRRPCKKWSNTLMLHSNRWSPFTCWAMKPGVEALIKLWPRDTRQRRAFSELLAHARNKHGPFHWTGAVCFQNSSFFFFFIFFKDWI